MSSRDNPESLALVAARAADEKTAAALAQRLGLPLLPTGSEARLCTEVHAVLLLDGHQLSLQRCGGGAPGPVVVQFGGAAMRHRRKSGANELLGRAVGVGKKNTLKVLDATAGLGRDSFVLADLRCEVLLCERQPVVLELLRFAMAYAATQADPWLHGVLQRMQICAGDARQLPADTMAAVDAIYLDPMFPARSKSAAVKKEMALLQWLLKDEHVDADAQSLLTWALQQDVSRVVVKRPAKGPQLAGLQPSHCIVGKAVRYDVFVQRKLS